MTALVERSFMRPYPQTALGNADGYTSDDLASVLGVSPKHIYDVMRKTDFFNHATEAGLNITTIVVKLNSRGRPRKVAVFDTEAAQIFAARYGSSEGFKFCQFLVRFHAKAREMIPDLQRQIQDMEKRLSDFEAKEARRMLPGPREGMMVAPVLQEDLFGGQMVLRWEWRHKETLELIEKLIGEERQTSRQLKGLTKKLVDVLDQRQVEEARRKGEIIKLVKK